MPAHRSVERPSRDRGTRSGRHEKLFLLVFEPLRAAERGRAHRAGTVGAGLRGGHDRCVRCRGNRACGAVCAATIFFGTLTVDVTSGAAQAVDVGFPGLAAFDMLSVSGPYLTSAWTITADNGLGDEMVLDFTTTPTAGSLAGFAGGIVFAGTVTDTLLGLPLYLAARGGISPVAVPEPSTLALLSAALPCLLGFGLARRRPAGLSPRLARAAHLFRRSRRASAAPAMAASTSDRRGSGATAP